MIASIIISVAFEVYEDFHEDGDFDFGWRYLGAAVSEFFSGLSGSLGYLMLYGFIGNSLDYFISGEFNSGTIGKDLLIMGGTAIAGVLIGKGLNLGLSKLKANSLFSLCDNGAANKLLSKMGLAIKIGSNAAQDNLGRIIYNSGKYFLGELMENVGSNSINNLGLLIFD
ncbi:hypothetical protein RJI07_08595 [Mycoplasmatota bacterium WC30]